MHVRVVGVNAVGHISGDQEALSDGLIDQLE